MSDSSFMMSRVRVAMIIHGALMMGVMAFGGIMAMLFNYFNLHHFSRIS